MGKGYVQIPEYGKRRNVLLAQSQLCTIHSFIHPPIHPSRPCSPPARENRRRRAPRRPPLTSSTLNGREYGSNSALSPPRALSRPSIGNMTSRSMCPPTCATRDPTCQLVRADGHHHMQFASRRQCCGCTCINRVIYYMCDVSCMSRRNGRGDWISVCSR